MVGPRRAAHAEESAEVEVLFANLEKLSGLTKKIQGSLNRLDTSGKNVQAAIGPVYGNTRVLQTTHRNIDRSIEVIEQFRAPLDRRDEEERIVRSDPRKVGVSEYISSLERLDRDLRRLRGSNLAANQASVKDGLALLKYGIRQLEDVFKQTLLATGGGGQIEPLHYITKDKPFPVLPEREASELRVINRFTASSHQNQGGAPGDHGTIKTYADIRGTYMARSLTTSSAASLSTARKLNADAIYRRGTCGIGAYASAIEGMITSEFDSIRMVFGREDWGRAVVPTCRPVFNDFGKTLRELNAHVQANLMTDCFLAFEIVEIVSGLALRLDAVFPEMKKPIAELLYPIRETARASLSRIIEDTKSRVQGLISLPSDSSAMPLSAEVVSRLQNLIDYITPVTSIMASGSERDRSWWTNSSSPTTSSANTSMRSFDLFEAPPGTDGQMLFAQYCSDVLETLVNGLDARARLLLKNQGGQAVFMCNNISVIENMLRASELGPLVASAVQPRIDTWRSKHVKLYLSAWTPASTTLLDVQYTSRSSGRPASGQGPPDSAAVVKNLSTKEKDNVKEKFRTFNTTFDDLVSKHRSYKMEKDVRPLLGRETQRIVEPLYGRFWDRYHEVDKGKGKYVRYSKAEMANVFATMS